MQKVTHRQIAPGVELTCVTAYKFKTGCVSLTLMTPLDKKTAAMNAVLPSVLRRGTARYPDMESIEAVLDDLYGARLETVVRKRGEVHCVGFYADFPDDAFVPRGGRILEDTVALMGEMLLSPSTSAGRLRRAYVEGERDNLIDDINAEINYKRSYATHRLIELMCKGEKYSVNKLGTVSDAEKITVATLTKHYKNLIATANIQVYYCGSASPDRVERAVRNALAALPRRVSGDLPATQVKYEPSGDKVKVLKEKMDVSQGRLVMGYRMGHAFEYPNPSAVMVMNALFGGCAGSKLFLNVREKLGICYYAHSDMDRHKGIMLVSSGIEFKNYDVCVEEITAQLEAIKSGDFDESELSTAKKAVITALCASQDSPAGFESMYLNRALLGDGSRPEELAAMAEEVTAENVIKCASGIKLDSIYFLTGEDDNA